MHGMPVVVYSKPVVDRLTTSTSSSMSSASKSVVVQCNDTALGADRVPMAIAPSSLRTFTQMNCHDLSDAANVRLAGQLVNSPGRVSIDTYFISLSTFSCGTSA